MANLCHTGKIFPIGESAFLAYNFLMKALLAGLIFVSSTFVLHAAETTVAAPDAPAPEFTVHEWGTFTTVSGSDGVLLPGLERDEEQLPSFVSGHKGLQAFGNRKDASDPNAFFMVADPETMRVAGKGIFRPVEQVTVKMETPVIYVYSDTTEVFPLQINVGFKQGLISQYFPGANLDSTPPMSYEPIAESPPDSPLYRIKPIDFSTPQNAMARWFLNVNPKSDIDDFKIVKAGETATWIRPRVREANVLTLMNGMQPEGFVFYRGLGHFDIPLKTTMQGDTLRLESERDIAYALVYQSDGYRAKVLWDGSLNAGKAKTVSCVPGGWENWRGEKWLGGDMQVDLLTRMQKALVAEGLSRDEASAMLRTWWDSYFCHAGLRVFWMVPREMTDEILPMTLSQKPKALERVLVGRAEVLTPAFESSMLATVQQADNPLQSDRYYAAYRARALAMNPELKLPEDPYDRRFELRRVERPSGKPTAAPAATASTP